MSMSDVRILFEDSDDWITVFALTQACSSSSSMMKCFNSAYLFSQQMLQLNELLTPMI